MKLDDIKKKLDLYNTGDLSERETLTFLVWMHNKSLFDSFHPKFLKQFSIYHAHRDIVLDENGQASINSRYHPLIEEPAVLKLKDVERTVVFQVGSFALDAFLSALFKTQFKFEAAEELGDGDIRTFDVEPKEMDADEVKEIETGKFDWLYQTGDMLNHACFLKLIKPGEYVVRNRC